MSGDNSAVDIVDKLCNCLKLRVLYVDNLWIMWIKGDYNGH